MMTPQHKAALYYASINWYVLPVWWPKPDGSCACGKQGCTDIGKHPITQRGQHDATVDSRQIDAWWSQHPSANIGIALAPSNLVAFDIDKPESYQAWAEIEAKYGTPHTTVQVSGSGCHHVLAQRPPFAIRGSYDKRITLRGNNFIVAAPSVHKSGGTYHWQEGFAPWEVPPAPLQPALAEALKRPEQTAPVDGNHDYPPATPELLASAMQALVKHGPEIKGVSPQGHTRTAWGILVNDFALSPQEAVPLIRAYNATCNPPWPEDKLFSSPCRASQQWNNPRGQQRDLLHIRAEMASYQPSPIIQGGSSSRSEWLESVASKPQPPMLFYSTGFEDLDKLMGGGFATRQVCGVMGPPSAGKSALVGHWLLNLSAHRPVLHVSTELPRYELFVRYAAHKMKFPWRDGIAGRVSQGDMAAAVKGTRIKLLGAEDLDRVDPMGCIEREMTMMAQECGVMPALAVDYIQMMARGASTEMRHKVGELTMRSRVMSQVFDTTVLNVFSTGRVVYGGKQAEAMRAANDPTVYLSAAKESGDIEFDCATLMYLDVDKLHEGNPKPGRIAVARCRVGDVGFVGVRAQLDIGQFWADPAAAAELASDERKAKREAEGIDEACKRLLEVIGKMPNRPWKEMQAATKCNYTVLNAARAKLLEDGVIEQIDRKGWDENRQKLRGTTLIIKSVVSPSESESS